MVADVSMLTRGTVRLPIQMKPSNPELGSFSPVLIGPETRIRTFPLLELETLALFEILALLVRINWVKQK
jgi:hypothetical protein